MTTQKWVKDHLEFTTMKTIEGKIIIRTNLENSKEIEKDSTIEQLLKAEQYINNEVAIDIYKKFGIGIRVYF